MSETEKTSWDAQEMADAFNLGWRAGFITAGCFIPVAWIVAYYIGLLS